MKAYEIKYGTMVVVEDENVIVPLGALPVNKGDEITIRRVDGMYCNGINADGERIYVALCTKVRIL